MPASVTETQVPAYNNQGVVETGADDRDLRGFPRPCLRSPGPRTLPVQRANSAMARIRLWIWLAMARPRPDDARRRIQEPAIRLSSARLLGAQQIRRNPERTGRTPPFCCVTFPNVRGEFVPHKAGKAGK